ncbi:MAG: hypothetical protein H7X95_06230 [Deltaproteobacteria bacterium]|nr:hypothetical protein [Deltaproteobacteria bacterium]
MEVSGEIVSSAGPDDLRMGVKFVGVGESARTQIDSYLDRVVAASK